MASISMEDEYDIIFVGGGTTACVTAARLANAASDLKILVLEGGAATKDKIDHIIPAQYFVHLSPDSTSNASTFYKSKPGGNVADRTVVVPNGGCVGGGSAINFMLYNRPAASDLDAWETAHSNPGWGSNDLIPLFQKSETYQIPTTPAARHGDSGPIKVSHGTYTTSPGREFLELGPKIEAKWNRPAGEDGNTFGEDSINIFYRMPKWISSDGRRSDAAHCYLYPAQARNPSLFISHGSRVNKINFQGKKAVAVEFSYNTAIHPDLKEHGPRVIKARKLIVLSAGALSSPLILERSGVGSKEILAKVGVETVEDLEGVGKEYQDHYLYFTPYLVHPEIDTYDPIYRLDKEKFNSEYKLWEQGTGMLGSNGIAESAIKVRPREEELEQIGPHFKAFWDTYFKDKPDKPVLWLSLTAGAPRLAFIPDLKVCAAGAVLYYPTSRGYIHIRSADPEAEPDFDGGFFNDLADVEVCRWAWKKTRNIITRLPCYQAPFLPSQPKFKEGSPAAFGSRTGPIPLDEPEPVYSAEDDAAIDANIRSVSDTSWHALGTCPMKPRELGGVVDSKLNVYGVTGLKIADLSIIPENVSANTYSVAVAIGEKAALIIGEELGIQV